MNARAFMVMSLVCWFFASTHFALAQADNGRWTKLGSLTLSDSSAQTLRLESNTKRTTAIRLVTSAKSISVKSLAIAYATGRVDHVAGPLRLSKGQQSPPIGKRQRSEVVEEIRFLFDGAPASGAQVVLQGLVVGEQDVYSGTQRDRGGSTKGKYVELDVYFATTRKRAKDRVKNAIKLASFSGEFTSRTTLGKAVVTVPKERAVGTIPRPYLGFVLLFRKEDPTKEFTIARVDVLDGRRFMRGMGRQAQDAKRFHRQAFVFVHGFNVQFDDALYHAAQLAHDIAFDGPAIVFSWPSRGNLLSYLYDREAAKASRNALRDFLTELAKSHDIDAVNVIAHSMGNEPLVDILNEQAVIRERGGKPLNMKLKEVVFAAPDVSRQVFKQLAGRLQSVVNGGSTLYASSKDIALSLSGGLVNLQDRAGYVPRSSPPFIIRDVETIDMTQASWIFSLNHSTFSQRRHLIDDLELLFSKGERPPHQRYKVFRPVDVVSGQRYWRYEQ